MARDAPMNKFMGIILLFIAAGSVEGAKPKWPECFQVLKDMSFGLRAESTLSLTPWTFLSYRGGLLVAAEKTLYDQSLEKRPGRKRDVPALIIHERGENPHSSSPRIQVQDYLSFYRLAALIPGSKKDFSWLENKILLVTSDLRQPWEIQRFRSIPLKLLRKENEFEVVHENARFFLSPKESSKPFLAVALKVATHQRPAYLEGSSRLVFFNAETGKRYWSLDTASYAPSINSVQFSTKARYAIVVLTYEVHGTVLLLDLHRKKILESKEYRLDGSLRNEARDWAVSRAQELEGQK
jgi:hypothetical protein